MNGILTWFRSFGAAGAAGNAFAVCTARREAESALDRRLDALRPELPAAARQGQAA